MSNKRRKRRVWPVIILVIFTGLFVKLFIDYFHETFTIRDIQVEGNIEVSDQKILELSRIRPGHSLFRFSAKQSEERISKHWLIREALVVREIPDGITIKVSERQPLLVMASGGRFVIMDEEGVCIEVIRRLSDSSLPYYAGQNIRETVYLGQKVIEPELLQVISFVKSIPAGYHYLVNEIDPGERTWSIYSINGLVVRLGTGEDLKRKFDLLERLLNETDILESSRDINYLDLSEPERPVVQYNN